MPMDEISYDHIIISFRSCQHPAYKLLLLHVLMFKYTTRTPNAYTNQISNELIAYCFPWELKSKIKWILY